MFIRRFQKSDTKEALEILFESFKLFLEPKLGEDFAKLFHKYTVEEFEAQAEHSSKNSETVTFVAVKSEKIVGYIQVSSSSNGLGVLDVVAVSPTIFAKGIGSMLMKTAEEYWHEKKQRKIHTCVSSHNKRAMLYYIKHDFIPEGLRKDHFFDGVDEVMLGRILN